MEEKPLGLKISGEVTNNPGLPGTEVAPRTQDFQRENWESLRQSRTSWSHYSGPPLTKLPLGILPILPQNNMD